MREVVRGSSYWIHSIVSVIASVILIVFFSFALNTKRLVVGIWISALSYIETPVVVCRNSTESLTDFFLARKNLNQKITEMELHLMSMQEAIERSSVPIVESEQEGYILADVVARSQDDWWNEFEINKGSLDGISEHSAVIADGFLVGKVKDVYPHASRVVMITSSEFIHVVTVADTRDLGLISGDGQGNITLSFIPVDRMLQDGMKIYTSIMSSSIPPGIAVGQVISVGEKKTLYRDYSVKAGAHLTQLYTVAIIKNSNKGNSTSRNNK